LTLESSNCSQRPTDNAGIAELLVITTRAVERHVHSIFSELAPSPTMPGNAPFIKMPAPWLLRQPARIVG
jgi:hypothetical protein